MKAVAYLRTSTLKDEDSISQQVQLAKITSFCESKGITLINSFYDNNVSGATLIRPELEKLKAFIKTTPVDYVIVYKLDRLARSMEASMFIRKDLRVLGAKTMYATQDMLNGDSPFVDFIENIITAFASFERQMIVERTLDGKAQKLSKQTTAQPKDFSEATVGGTRPYGFGKGNPEVIKAIYAMKAKGYTQVEIADTLNAQGIKAPKGGKWSQPTIRYILKNKKYVGIYSTKLKGETYTSAIVPIV